MNKIPNLESLSNLRVDLDKSSFDIMLNALNSIQFQINTIKGIKQYPYYDTQKYATKRQIYGMAFKNKISDENPMNFNFMNK